MSSTIQIADCVHVCCNTRNQQFLTETLCEALENPYQSYKIADLCRPKDIACSAAFRLGGATILAAASIVSGHQQNCALADYLQTTVMLQHNNRKAL